VIHQDRAFWVGRETKPTLFTAWVSLAAIHAKNGALTFNLQNKVAPPQVQRFNTQGTLHEHVEYQYGGQNSSLAVAPAVAEQLRSQMSPIEAVAGSVILFDGFEPHGSTDNESDSSRLALKIVYGEGVGRAAWLVKLAELSSV